MSPAAVAVLLSLALSSSGNAVGPATPPPRISACGDYKALRELLRASYGETEKITGVTNQGGVLATFASPDFATWTAVALAPDGKSACVVAAGTHLEITPPGKEI